MTAIVEIKTKSSSISFSHGFDGFSHGEGVKKQIPILIAMSNYNCVLRNDKFRSYAQLHTYTANHV